MTHRQRISIIISIQSALFLAVILIPYDPIQRRLALALTNVVTTAAICLIDWDVRRRGGNLPLWAMLVGVAAVWLDAMANFWLLYTWVWWWDRFTHAFGGLALGILAAQLWRPRVQNNITATWLGLWVGQTIGAWYEISEYLGDMWFKTWRVMSIYDSPRDLWFNFLGGIAAVGIMLLAYKQRVAGKARKVL